MTHGWGPELGGSPPGRQPGPRRRPDPAKPAGPRGRWQPPADRPAEQHGARPEAPDRWRAPAAPPAGGGRHVREPGELVGYPRRDAPRSDPYDPPPAGRRRAEPDPPGGRLPPPVRPTPPGRPAPTARPAPPTRPAPLTRPVPPRGDPLTTTGSGRRRGVAAPEPLTPPPPGRPDVTGTGGWRASRPKRWYVVLAGLGVLATLVTCGAFSYQLVQDELAGRNAQADSGEPSATVPRDISSREADPEPLTVEEVFPTDKIVINPDEPPYRVLETDASKDCREAAADRLQTLLEDLGCSQVVRATVRSPNEDYLITGGVLNLATRAGAEQAYRDIKPLIEDGTGRFLGLLAGDGTEPILLSETVLFWDYRGHYLMYAVVARSDGEEFSAADNRYADLVSWDIIEVHLRGGVLEARATQPNPDATGDG